jgi:hypothetical protein
MKDKCVSCETESLYNKEDHIDFRIGDVEGAGQLCLSCYDKIYGWKSLKEDKEKGYIHEIHRNSRKSS